jgi:hypothetical protein
MIRQGGDRIGEGALARRLAVVHVQSERQPLQAYQAIARQALRAVDAGQDVERAGARPLLRADLPRIPEGDAGPGRITYRILVTVRANDGTGEVRYAIDLHSTTPRSFADISAEVASRFIALHYRDSARQELRALGADVSVETMILAAGRT